MTGPDAAATFESLSYEEIERAVMATARGRWFLAEFARRSRGLDTQRVLDAIGRLDARLPRQSASPAAAGPAPAAESPGRPIEALMDRLRDAIEQTTPVAPAAPANDASPQSFAAIDAMSPEERLRLFL